MRRWLSIAVAGLTAGCHFVTPLGASCDEAAVCPGGYFCVAGYCEPGSAPGADSGAVDAGTTDAGSMDAGSVDSGTRDGGSIDSGQMDSGPTDAGATDAGSMDAGLRDAGSRDSGPVDAGPTPQCSDGIGPDGGYVGATDCDGGTICTLDDQCLRFRYFPFDGVVSDQDTGLAWQEAPPAMACMTDAGDPELCDWPSAIRYCNGLSLLGGGWRLPSMPQLFSLVESADSPTIDPMTFSGTAAGWFWTTTPFVQDLNSSYVVDFTDGKTYASDRGETENVRCVRLTDAGWCSDGMSDGGEAIDGGSVNCPEGEVCGLSGICAAPDYTHNSDGNVTDNATGLTWQQPVPGSQCSGGNACTQPEAVSYCAGSDGGWRLPTLSELFSLVDTGNASSIDQTYFMGTPADLFWTSDGVDGGRAWCVYFTSGYTDNPSSGLSGAVRCVR